jgi:hypothetical protein
VPGLGAPDPNDGTLFITVATIRVRKADLADVNSV